jgi:hypothetical protein
MEYLLNSSHQSFAEGKDEFPETAVDMQQNEELAARE